MLLAPEGVGRQDLLRQAQRGRERRAKAVESQPQPAPSLQKEKARSDCSLPACAQCVTEKVEQWGRCLAPKKTVGWSPERMGLRRRTWEMEKGTSGATALPVRAAQLAGSFPLKSVLARRDVLKKDDVRVLESEMGQKISSA
jgi:hypothetical protein